jgi:membrane-bound lytic murein transglycosylase A
VFVSALSEACSSDLLSVAAFPHSVNNAGYQVKQRRKTRKKLWIIKMAGMAAFLCLARVQAQPPQPRMPIIADDLDRESLRSAIVHSLAYLAKLPSDQIVGLEPRRFTAGEVIATLQAFEETLQQWHCRECWVREITARFNMLPSSNNSELQPVLFTGYYQPVIEASLVPTPEYRYPIYGMPGDLIAVEESRQTSGLAGRSRIGRMENGRLIPYYSRAEIDGQGALRGRGLEIAWTKDPVDIFFLQVQGSGILQLPNGHRMQLGYAGQNGLPYRSIGRLLIDEGKIPSEEMSMQRLRRYLAEHPQERDRIMAHNESYVFFRFLSTGPLGSLEVPVTAGRSIATDSRLFPRGALAFIYSERPVLDAAGRLLGWTPFLRFVLNQDTGGAIRGLQRVDLFFGADTQAAAEAGYMNSLGKLYFLALKNPPR